jgi:hypothetical protein
MFTFIIGLFIGSVSVVLYNKYLATKVDAEVAVVKEDVKKAEEKVEEVAHDVMKRF